MYSVINTIIMVTILNIHNIVYYNIHIVLID